LLLLVVYKNSADRSEFADGELIRYMRVGRQALHPDYGPGVLDAFVEISVLGETTDTARFHFDRYPGVSFFIPVTHSLPAYGYRRGVSRDHPDSTARIRRFVIGEKPKVAIEEVLS
jgi:hypothetical protein